MTDLKGGPGGGGAGPQGPLEDDPIQFFFRNIDLIRQWADLSDRAGKAVEAELSSLGDEVQTALDARHQGISVTDRLVGRPATDGVFLHRPSWHAPGADAPEFGVGIGYGWDNRPLVPAGAWPRYLRPYVGFLISPGSSRAAAFNDAVRAKAYGDLRGSGYVRGGVWVVYRPFESSPNWYEDIPAWRRFVVSQLLHAWDDCSPYVDNWLENIDR